MQELVRTSSQLTEFSHQPLFQRPGMYVLTIFRNVEDLAAVAVGANEFKLLTHLRLMHRCILNS